MRGYIFRNITKDDVEEWINEFTSITAAITGILMGAGFAFIGLVLKPSFWIFLFGLVSIIAGSIATLKLFRDDEYEKIASEII